MAKSNKPAAKAAAKPARARTTEVEVVEESGGMTWEDGVSIITAIVLVAAIALADKGLSGFGAGVFFS